jgi:hypothetical protein
VFTEYFDGAITRKITIARDSINGSHLFKVIHQYGLIREETTLGKVWAKTSLTQMIRMNI